MKLKTSFYPWFVFAFIASYLIHEAAHWLMGAALGIDVEYHLNAVRYLSPTLPWQRALADAAGPAVTILQAIVAYVLVQRGALSKAFAFLYVAAFMRFAAGLVTVLNPNDEARLSTYMGLGKWTLPVLVAAGLIVLAAKGSRRLGLTWKDQLACYVVASLAIAAIVGLDRFLL